MTLAFCLVINNFSTDDRCILSVPSSTNKLRWQSGEICQVLFTETFTSFYHTYDGTRSSSLPRHPCLLATHVAEELTVLLCHPRVLLLPTKWSSRRFPSSRTDIGSFRSCLQLPLGFLDTLEAGICAESRAWCFFCVFPRCPALCFLTACEECSIKRW